MPKRIFFFFQTCQKVCRTATFPPGFQRRKLTGRGLVERPCCKSGPTAWVSARRKTECAIDERFQKTTIKLTSCSPHAVSQELKWRTQGATDRHCIVWPPTRDRNWEKELLCHYSVAPTALCNSISGKEHEHELECQVSTKIELVISLVQSSEDPTSATHTQTHRKSWSITAAKTTHRIHAVSCIVTTQMLSYQQLSEILAVMS